MTDKQLALAAIEALNKARDLLESSTDQAQHAIADDVADIVLHLKKLKFHGRLLGLTPVAYSFCHDAGSDKWLVTEEFVSGYAVIAEFATKNEAQDYVEDISNGGRR